jgi:hypothetical protein
MLRAPTRAVAAALGLLLLPVGAAWRGAEGGPAFALSFAGRELWTGDRAALEAALERLAAPGWAGAVLLALIAGWCLARALPAADPPAPTLPPCGPPGSASGFGSVRRFLLFSGGVLVALLAVAPFVPAFVASRQPGAAAAYLDVEDLVHGLGWALVFLAVVTSFRRDRPQPVAAPRGPEGGGAGVGGSGADRAGRALDERPPPGGVALPAVVAALVVLAGAQLGLEGRPLTNDEVAYRYQAELFAAGEVARATAHPEFFPARQIALVPEAAGGARAFSKYPPGHSLVLAPLVRLGALWLAAPLTAALAVLLAARVAARLGARRPARAAWLVALSPLFLGAQALSLSHSTALVFTSAFAIAALRALDAAEEGRSATADAVAAGVALSLALATRPVTALAVALPFAVLAVLAGARGLRLAGFAALGAVPGVALFLAVNDLQTGLALRTAYGVYADLERELYPDLQRADRFPFPGWTATALPNTGYNLARLGVWLHGPGLSLLLPLAGLALAPPRRRWLCVGVPAALLAAYALHWFAGIPWAGPVYLVEALPFLAALSAGGLDLLAPSRRARWAALGIALLASAQLLLGHLAAARTRIAERDAPFAAAREAGLEHGVVFVPVGGGGAKRYALPPPAPDARLVFAADLGPRNAVLRAALGDPPAYRFDPATGDLIELH